MDVRVSVDLSVRGLRLEHAGREFVHGIDLALRPGEIRALMGASGAGKTTILRALVALHPFSGGKVRISEVELHPGRVPPERQLRTLRRRIGLVFQAPSLFAHLTAVQNVTLAPVHALGVEAREARERAVSLLAELGVERRAEAYPHQLSGGEAQRVAIARALAPDPTFLLMDEPTAALDPGRRAGLGQTLRQLARNGRGILVATHDVDFAKDVCDRVSVLAAGLIVEEGPAHELLASPSHPATRELLDHRDS